LGSIDMVCQSAVQDRREFSSMDSTHFSTILTVVANSIRFPFACVLI
jgi:hypothetical protein